MFIVCINVCHGVICSECHSLHMQDVNYVPYMNAFNAAGNELFLPCMSVPEVFMGVRAVTFIY